MTFEGQYLTYAEYQELGGSAIGEMPFNLLEFRARKEIDINTQNRLVNLEEIPNEVKLCVFDLINTIQKYTSEKRNNNISSQTVGSYSVTYEDISKVLEDKNVEITSIIMNSLYGLIINNEHVIYRGVNQ